MGLAHLGAAVVRRVATHRKDFESHPPYIRISGGAGTRSMRLGFNLEVEKEVVIQRVGSVRVEAT